MVDMEPRPCTYSATRSPSQDLMGSHPWQTGSLVGKDLTPLQTQPTERNLFVEERVWLSMDVGLEVRVFANGPGDLGSIPGRVIPKTQKMVLDASLLNTQHYKVRIKGKVEKSRERSSALPYTLV